MSAPTCPQCPGKGVYLGSLGIFRCYRCRDCGWTFQRRRKLKAPKSKIVKRAALKLGAKVIDIPFDSEPVERTTEAALNSLMGDRG